MFFHISIRIFCTLFIFLVFDGLFQLIHFRMFCSKHSITFENMYPLSCWFHSVDIFYIKFRFCETYTVSSSVTRNLLIKTLSNLSNSELISIDLPDTFFARKQLKISEIYMLFQPIKLRIFCIITIIGNMCIAISR